MLQEVFDDRSADAMDGQSIGGCGRRVDDRQGGRHRLGNSSDPDAMEEFGIEFRAKRGDDAARLVLAEVAQQKGLIGQRQAGGEIFREDHIGARLDDRLHVLVVRGADYRGNDRVLLPQTSQDPFDRGVSIEGDDDEPCLAETGGREDPAMRGVAMHHPMALPLSLLEASKIRFDGEIGDVCGLERTGDEPADAPAPAQQNMPVQGRAHRANCRLGLREVKMRAPEQISEPPAALDHQGRQSHREGEGDQQRLSDIGGEQTRADRHGHEQQAEFAPMGEVGGDAQGQGGSSAKREADEEGHQAFPEHHHQAPRQDRAGRDDDQREIDPHPHGDEEQADKDVAKRAQIVLDAMFEITAADGHAGEVIAASRIDPRWLTLELTESKMAENSAEMVETMKRLRALGVGLSIDDFGTGYANLRYLEELPISELKIDRSFVRGIAQSRSKSIIVEALVRLSHELGFQIVAEGIETPEECARLRDLGCHHGQGFLFGKAIDPDAFADLVAKAAPSRDRKQPAPG